GWEEGPLGAGGGQAGGAEAADPAVVLAVAEHGLGQAGALGVGGGALGGAEQVLHLFDGGGVWRGWAGGSPQFAGGASLFVVFHGGDQAVRAGAGGVVL